MKTHSHTPSWCAHRRPFCFVNIHSVVCVFARLCFLAPFLFLCSLCVGPFLLASWLVYKLKTYYINIILIDFFFKVSDIFMLLDDNKNKHKIVIWIFFLIWISLKYFFWELVLLADSTFLFDWWDRRRRTTVEPSCLLIYLLLL